MKRIYIAGPMTGKPDLNRAEFVDAKFEIYAMFIDASTINPVEVAGAYDWDLSTPIVKIAKQMLRLLLNCDAIYMLRGWQDSKGATAEHAVAKWIGLEIIYQGEGE